MVGVAGEKFDTAVAIDTAPMVVVLASIRMSEKVAINPVASVAYRLAMRIPIHTRNEAIPTAP